MQVIQSPVEMALWAKERSADGQRIALVPTMGSFHDGHLQLMRCAAGKADQVVVSLFVNPIQFGPTEDFAAYPRDFEEDCNAAAREKVDIVFAPEAEQMYPEGFQTVISAKNITRHLCGAARPGHFDGVATVLVKLFNLTGADYAVFGEKDYQQLAMIRRLVVDLNLNLEIVGHPIVREPDGLAMSSRNAYLDRDDRPAALSLYKSIVMGQEYADSGMLVVSELERLVREHILSYPGTEIDYVSFVDCGSLESVTRVDKDTLMALAVKINGKVRLIDNGFVLPRG